jgi:HD-GYP domain-containing protein (c-di-GMP phosphodiesterase class II)
VTRLTDLIQGQSSHESANPDAKNHALSMSPAGLSHPTPTRSQSVTENDWYQRACHIVQGIKRAVQTRQPWVIDDVVSLAAGIVTSLRTNDQLLEKVLQRDAGDFVVTNAVNVAIVSVKIGEGLEYESAKLEQIALAGLLHDLGMFVLPDSLLYRASALTEEEVRTMREHPQHGSRLVEDLGASYSWVGRVILQEHERMDGSGYPGGLTGDHIDEMALIIGLADAFDAMMNSRPYRRGKLPHQTIRTLLTSGKTVFPHHLLKALVEQFSIYPLGTTVRLNTGETGVVSQLNRQYPLRPILRLLQSGHAPVSKTVDLRAETALHIVEVVPIG